MTREQMDRKAHVIIKRAAILAAKPDRQGTRSMAVKARDNANMALNARTDEGAALFLRDAEIYLHDAA